MTSKRKINFNYLNRDFGSLKQDLMSYVKAFYPERYNDFSESSVGMMLLELNAYVGDILSYHVDKNFNELFLDTAQNRDSVIRLANNLGYNVRGKKPAVTALDVSINVPPDGDDPDEDYLITIQTGMQVKSNGGATFEVVDDIVFSERYNSAGVQNRWISPVYNASNEIESYTITKRVAAVAGEIKYGKLEISSINSVPFLKWYIDNDDTEITEITHVISKGDRFAPTEFSDWTDSGSYNYWYQVDSLPQERVFVDTGSGITGSGGYWKYVEKRYVVKYDENGRCYLTFGAGIEDYSSYDEFLINGSTGLTPATMLNNDSLGEIPAAGTYLHCRYRSGGGTKTNAAQGSITKIASKTVSYVPGGGGVDVGELSSVISSLSCTNPIPAIGGREFQTIDEIKAQASHHYAAQDRCVTVKDYISRISLMPAQYGTVFRSYAAADPEGLNTKLYILTLDENGKLKNTGNDTIKSNIAAYLQNYKVLNDFVVIDDGRIINIGMNFSVQVEGSYNKREVIVNCINKLKDYFDIRKWEMSDAIYISQIVELLREQPGVINVIDVQFVNKVGGNYSRDVLGGHGNLSELSRITSVGEIKLTPVNNKLKSPITGMFEVKYPEVDIRGAAI
jgi:hypothetical protein